MPLSQLILAEATPRTFWMPEGASTFSAEVDWLFYFIYYISIFFTVLIAALLVYFAVRFRHRPGQPETRAPEHAGHNNMLEIVWSVVPAIIVVAIFYWGFRGYLRMSEVPANTYEIQVTAYAWGWTFVYPDGTTTSDLYLPLDVPVRFSMTSEDVIHSMFIPQMRIKKDAVPGRINTFWLQATAPTRTIDAGSGEVVDRPFDLFCTEYCGTRHSMMTARVHVLPVREFQETLEDLGRWEDKMSPVEAGKMLSRTFGCFNCHSIDGVAMSGPTWLNLYGSVRNFTDGTSAVADTDYIVESIKYPGRRIVVGYGNVMPSYLGRMRDADILAVVAYMRSISENFQGNPNLYEGAPPPLEEPESQPAN